MTTRALKARLTDAIGVKPLVFEGAYDPNLAQFQDLVAAAEKATPSESLVALSHPELVARMHHEYMAAGCDVLQTHTWGLHRSVLDPSVDDDTIKRASRNAAEIASRVAETASGGRPCWVAGIVPASIWPVYRIGAAMAQSAAGLIAEGLISGGVDCIVLALQSRFADAVAAFDGVTQACGAAKACVPIFVSFDIGPVGVGPAGLASGDDLSHALLTCERNGAFSVGAYLTTHPERLPETLLAGSARKKPVHAFADAGYATEVEANIRHSLEPREYGEIVAEQARRLGLAFIGGGWGVSPRHIHELRVAVDSGINRLI
jgi:methionine synthase I (cobalamin-dependent)